MNETNHRLMRPPPPREIQAHVGSNGRTPDTSQTSHASDLSDASSVVSEVTLDPAFDKNHSTEERRDPHFHNVVVAKSPTTVTTTTKRSTIAKQESLSLSKLDGSDFLNGKFKSAFHKEISISLETDKNESQGIMSEQKQVIEQLNCQRQISEGGNNVLDLLTSPNLVEKKKERHKRRKSTDKKKNESAHDEHSRARLPRIDEFDVDRAKETPAKEISIHPKDFLLVSLESPKPRRPTKQHGLPQRMPRRDTGDIPKSITISDAVIDDIDLCAVDLMDYIEAQVQEVKDADQSQVDAEVKEANQSQVDASSHQRESSPRKERKTTRSKTASPTRRRRTTPTRNQPETFDSTTRRRRASSCDPRSTKREINASSTRRRRTSSSLSQNQQETFDSTIRKRRASSCNPRRTKREICVSPTRRRRTSSSLSQNQQETSNSTTRRRRASSCDPRRTRREICASPTRRRRTSSSLSESQQETSDSTTSRRRASSCERSRREISASPTRRRRTSSASNRKGRRDSPAPASRSRRKSAPSVCSKHKKPSSKKETMEKRSSHSSKDGSFARSKSEASESGKSRHLESNKHKRPSSKIEKMEKRSSHSSKDGSFARSKSEASESSKSRHLESSKRESETSHHLEINEEGQVVTKESMEKQDPNVKKNLLKTMEQDPEFEEIPRVPYKRVSPERVPSVKRLSNRLQMMEQDPDFEEIMRVAIGGLRLRKSSSAPDLLETLNVPGKPKSHDSSLTAVSVSAADMSATPIRALMKRMSWRNGWSNGRSFRPTPLSEESAILSGSNCTSSASNFTSSSSDISSMQGSRGMRSHDSSRNSNWSRTSSELTFGSNGQSLAESAGSGGANLPKRIHGECVSPIVSTPKTKRQYTPTVVKNGSKSTLSYSERVLQGQIGMPGTRSILKPTPEGRTLCEF